MTENRNGEKLKILEMLAEGKITVEESLALLRQIPEGREHKEYNDEYNDEYDDDTSLGEELSNLGRRIKESVQDAVRELEDVDININLSDVLGGSHRSTMTYVSDPIPQNIAALSLIGKNADVKIMGYGGSQLRITCKFNAKRSDARVRVQEDNGSYEVLYDYNAMRSMSIHCEVPRIFVENIHGESKNSSVELQGIKARHVNLLTKNSSIKIGKVDCEEITGRTRNSAIRAERLNANAIDFETSNSKIDLEEVAAQIARLSTTNSKVVTESCDIKQLYIKTSNAGIKVDNSYAAAQNEADGIERIVEAHTTNGGVQIYIPSKVAIMLQASTTAGRVKCELDNMLINESSRNYLSGKSMDYETAARRAKINVSTTNSSIKIEEAD